MKNAVRGWYRKSESSNYRFSLVSRYEYTVHTDGRDGVRANADHGECRTPGEPGAGDTTTGLSTIGSASAWCGTTSAAVSSHKPRPGRGSAGRRSTARSHGTWQHGWGDGSAGRSQGKCWYVLFGVGLFFNNGSDLFLTVSSRPGQPSFSFRSGVQPTDSRRALRHWCALSLGRLFVTHFLFSEVWGMGVSVML